MSRLRLRPHRKVPTNHPNAKILRLIHTREVGRLTSCLSSDSIGVMDPPPAWKWGAALVVQVSWWWLSCRQLQNIRLGSAAANPLSRSRNQRADEDG